MQTLRTGVFLALLLSAAQAASSQSPVWDNGAYEVGGSGLVSARDAYIRGRGGPEGDHAATVVDDFEIRRPTRLSQVEVCFLLDKMPLAEMYVFPDLDGEPALVPLLGAPTSPDITTLAWAANTPRCRPFRRWTGAEIRFDLGPAGPILQPGRYWLAVVVDGLGDIRVHPFWAQSSPEQPLERARWGAEHFWIPYWTPIDSRCGTCRDFSFRIYGEQVSVVEVPATSEFSRALMVVFLGLAGVSLLRRI